MAVDAPHPRRIRAVAPCVAFRFGSFRRFNGLLGAAPGTRAEHQSGEVRDILGKSCEIHVKSFVLANGIAMNYMVLLSCLPHREQGYIK